MNVIIQYNGGNVHSLQGALRRIGAEAVVSSDPEVIRSAERVFFPGVGHFSAAMDDLRARGIVQLIPQLDQPFLGICLGMQLLSSRSEEGQADGLGIMPGQVKLIREEVTVPHMGWNSVEATSGPLFNGLSNGTDFYFVHSYALDPDVFTSAEVQHGKAYAAAIQRDNYYGVQFHPEKSGEQGEILLRNFLQL